MSDEEAKKLKEAKERIRGVALGLAAMFGPLAAARLLLEASEQLTREAEGLAPGGGIGTA